MSHRSFILALSESLGHSIEQIYKNSKCKTLPPVTKDKPYFKGKKRGY